MNREAPIRDLGVGLEREEVDIRHDLLCPFRFDALRGRIAVAARADVVDGLGVPLDLLAHLTSVCQRRTMYYILPLRNSGGSYQPATGKWTARGT